MPDCECLPRCPFFHDRMERMPTMATLMKKRFCTWDNSECARFYIFKRLGPAKVPADMFPNQIERARAIVGTQAPATPRA